MHRGVGGRRQNAFAASSCGLLKPLTCSCGDPGDGLDGEDPDGRLRHLPNGVDLRLRAAQFSNGFFPLSLAGGFPCFPVVSPSVDNNSKGEKNRRWRRRRRKKRKGNSTDGGKRRPRHGSNANLKEEVPPLPVAHTQYIKRKPSETTPTSLANVPWENHKRR